MRQSALWLSAATIDNHQSNQSINQVRQISLIIFNKSNRQAARQRQRHYILFLPFCRRRTPSFTPQSRPAKVESLPACREEDAHELQQCADILITFYSIIPALRSQCSKGSYDFCSISWRAQVEPHQNASLSLRNYASHCFSNVQRHGGPCRSFRNTMCTCGLSAMAGRSWFTCMMKELRARASLIPDMAIMGSQNATSYTPARYNKRAWQSACRIPYELASSPLKRA